MAEKYQEIDDGEERIIRQQLGRLNRLHKKRTEWRNEDLCRNHAMYEYSQTRKHSLTPTKSKMQKCRNHTPQKPKSSAGQTKTFTCSSVEDGLPPSSEVQSFSDTVQPFYMSPVASKRPSFNGAQEIGLPSASIAKQPAGPQPLFQKQKSGDAQYCRLLYSEKGAIGEYIAAPQKRASTSSLWKGKGDVLGRQPSRNARRPRNQSSLPHFAGHNDPQKLSSKMPNLCPTPVEHMEQEYTSSYNKGGRTSHHNIHTRRQDRVKSAPIALEVPEHTFQMPSLPHTGRWTEENKEIFHFQDPNDTTFRQTLAIDRLTQIRDAYQSKDTNFKRADVSSPSVTPLRRDSKTEYVRQQAMSTWHAKVRNSAIRAELQAEKVYEDCGINYHKAILLPTNPNQQRAKSATVPRRRRSTQSGLQSPKRKNKRPPTSAWESSCAVDVTGQLDFESSIQSFSSRDQSRVVSGQRRGTSHAALGHSPLNTSADVLAHLEHDTGLLHKETDKAPLQPSILDVEEEKHFFQSIDRHAMRIQACVRGCQARQKVAELRKSLSKKHLVDLTVDEVGWLLRSWGLGRYVAGFQEMEVMGADLALCEDKELKQCGMEFRPHRKRLLDNIKSAVDEGIDKEKWNTICLAFSDSPNEYQSLFSSRHSCHSMHSPKKSQQSLLSGSTEKADGMCHVQEIQGSKLQYEELGGDVVDISTPKVTKHENQNLAATQEITTDSVVKFKPGGSIKDLNQNMDDLGTGTAISDEDDASLEKLKEDLKPANFGSGSFIERIKEARKTEGGLDLLRQRIRLLASGSSDDTGDQQGIKEHQDQFQKSSFGDLDEVEVVESLDENLDDGYRCVVERIQEATKTKERMQVLKKQLSFHAKDSHSDEVDMGSHKGAMPFNKIGSCGSDVQSHNTQQDANFGDGYGCVVERIDDVTKTKERMQVLGKQLSFHAKDSYSHEMDMGSHKGVMTLNKTSSCGSDFQSRNTQQHANFGDGYECVVERIEEATKTKERMQVPKKQLSFNAKHNQSGDVQIHKTQQDTNLGDGNGCVVERIEDGTKTKERLQVLEKQLSCNAKDSHSGEVDVGSPKGVMTFNKTSSCGLDVQSHNTQQSASILAGNDNMEVQSLNGEYDIGIIDRKNENPWESLVVVVNSDLAVGSVELSEDANDFTDIANLQNINGHNGATSGTCAKALSRSNSQESSDIIPERQEHFQHAMSQEGSVMTVGKPFTNTPDDSGTSSSRGFNTSHISFGSDQIGGSRKINSCSSGHLGTRDLKTSHSYPSSDQIGQKDSHSLLNHRPDQVGASRDINNSQNSRSSERSRSHQDVDQNSGELGSARDLTSPLHSPTRDKLGIKSGLDTSINRQNSGQSPETSVLDTSHVSNSSVKTPGQSSETSVLDTSHVSQSSGPDPFGESSDLKAFPGNLHPEGPDPFQESSDLKAFNGNLHSEVMDVESLKSNEKARSCSQNLLSESNVKSLPGGISMPEVNMCHNQAAKYYVKDIIQDRLEVFIGQRLYINAATTIQAVARGFLVRLHTFQFKHEFLMLHNQAKAGTNPRVKLKELVGMWILARKVQSPKRMILDANHVLLIKHVFKDDQARKMLQSFSRQICAALILRKAVRMFLARKKLQQRKQLLQIKKEAVAAILIQSHIKKKIAQQELNYLKENAKRNEAAVMMQKMARSKISRNLYNKRRTETLRLQATFRHKRLQRQMVKQQKAAIHIQTAFRKHQAKVRAEQAVRQRPRRLHSMNFTHRRRMLIHKMAKESKAARTIQSFIRRQKALSTHQESEVGNRPGVLEDFEEGGQHQGRAFWEALFEGQINSHWEPSSIKEQLQFLQFCIEHTNTHSCVTTNARNLIAWLGNTGSGKSTAITFLYGDRLQHKLKETQRNLSCKLSNCPHKQSQHSNTIHHAFALPNSRTIHPVVSQVENTSDFLCDFPGFLGSCAEINIANSINMVKILNHAKSLRFVLCVRYSSLYADRGQSFSNLLNAVEQLCGSQQKMNKFLHSTIIGITCAPDHSLKKLQLFFQKNFDQHFANILAKNLLLICPPLNIKTNSEVPMPSNTFPRDMVLQRIQSLPSLDKDAFKFKTVISSNDVQFLLALESKLQKQMEILLENKEFKEAQQIVCSVEDILKFNLRDSRLQSLLANATTITLKCYSSRIKQEFVGFCLQGQFNAEMAQKRIDTLNAFSAAFSGYVDTASLQDDLKQASEWNKIYCSTRKYQDGVIKAQLRLKAVIQQALSSFSDKEWEKIKSKVENCVEQIKAEIGKLPDEGARQAHQSELQKLQRLFEEKKNESDFIRNRKNDPPSFLPVLSVLKNEIREKNRSSEILASPKQQPIVSNPKPLSVHERLQRLDFCISSGREKGEKTGGKHVIMLVGNPGVGKSTMVNLLCGCRLERVEGTDSEFRVAGGAKEVSQIGHGMDSCTLFPRIFNSDQEDTVYCDCPGFNDTRGVEINLGNMVNLVTILNRACSVKFVVLLNYLSLDADRGKGLSDLISVLTQIFKERQNISLHAGSMLLCLTHVPPSQTKNAIECLIEHSRNKSELGTSIKDLFHQVIIFDPIEDSAKFKLENAIRQLASLRTMKSSMAFLPEDEDALLTLMADFDNELRNNLHTPQNLKQATFKLELFLNILNNLTTTHQNITALTSFLRRATETYLQPRIEKMSQQFLKQHSVDVHFVNIVFKILELINPDEYQRQKNLFKVQKEQCEMQKFYEMIQQRPENTMKSLEKALSQRCSQKVALIHLFMSTEGNGWKRSKNWISPADVCHWEGITCDERGNVISINLSNNNLTGTLPDNIFEDLKFLKRLDLSRNKLFGELPLSLEDAESLHHVLLNDNQDLVGPVPEKLKNNCNINNTWLDKQNVIRMHAPNFPFYVCSKVKFLQLDSFYPFEEAKEIEGLMSILSPSGNPAFERWKVLGAKKSTTVCRNEIIFASHRWLSVHHPDDANGSKMTQLKNILHQGSFEEVKYLWIDFFCIPQDQKNKEKQQRAINSLPYYLKCSQHFVSLLGTSGQAQLSVYKKRGWCRLERFAALTPELGGSGNPLPTELWVHWKETDTLEKQKVCLQRPEDLCPLRGVFFDPKDKLRISKCLVLMCWRMIKNGDNVICSIGERLMKSDELKICYQKANEGMGVGIFEEDEAARSIQRILKRYMQKRRLRWLKDNDRQRSSLASFASNASFNKSQPNLRKEKTFDDDASTKHQHDKAYSHQGSFQVLQKVWLYDSPETLADQIAELYAGTILRTAEPHPQFKDHPSLKNGNMLHVVDPYDGYVNQWNEDGTANLEKVVEDYDQQGQYQSQRPFADENHAEVPEPWIQQIDPDTNSPYYYNFETGESTWDITDTYNYPSDAPLQDNKDPYWEKKIDPESGSKYYEDANTGATQWDTPTPLKSKQMRPRFPKPESLQAQVLAGAKPKAAMTPRVVIDHAEGWEEHRDPENGLAILFNRETKESMWANDDDWDAQVKLALENSKISLHEADFEIESSSSGSSEEMDDYNHGIEIKSELLF